MTRDLRAQYGGWALVTGASSGIGACFAESLARRGFPVVLVARRRHRLDELATRLHAEHGVETHVVDLDLAQPASIARLADAVGDREVGLVVANAGFGYSGRFADLAEEDYVRMVQLNCTGVVALVRRFLPPMLRRGRGGVVVVSSLAGHQPTPWFTVYGATKAFDLALAEGLWSELRGTGVDVLALCPGTTETEFSSQAHFDRPPHGADPREVVETCLARLGRGPSVVTGLQNKVAALLHRFVPRSVAANATGSVLARELLRAPPSELRRRSWTRDEEEASGPAGTPR
jgi:uncharacterized protein